MFPYSGRFPAEFVFKGPNVMAKSSGNDDDNFHISHSCISNRSVASLHMTLDSSGLAELQCYFCNQNENGKN